MKPLGSVPVHLRAWGVTQADIEYAIDRAGIGPGRTAWQPEIVRLSGTPCPIDVGDPTVIAAEFGYHWAYAAYPANRPSA